MTPSEVENLFRVSVDAAKKKLAPTLANYSKNGWQLFISQSEIDRILAEVLRLAKICPRQSPGDRLSKQTFASICLVAIQTTTIPANLFNFGSASRNLMIGKDMPPESADKIFGEFCAVIFTASSGAKLSSITSDPDVWESLVRFMTTQGKTRKYEFPAIMLARQFPGANSTQ